MIQGSEPCPWKIIIGGLATFLILSFIFMCL